MDAGGFGGIDLNIPFADDFPAGMHGDEAPNVTGPYGVGEDVNIEEQATMQTGGPSETGQTLSSAESDSDCEVQSTLEGFVLKTPFLGMLFDSPEAALLHYKKKVLLQNIKMI